MINITFMMTPVAKARARVTRRYAYTPDKTADAELFIVHKAIEYLEGAERPVYKKDVPLIVFCHFYLPPFKYLLNNKDYLAGNLCPTGRLDLDNYIKLVMDAVTGIFYFDDSQVVSLHAEKHYVRPGEEPRVELSIDSLEEL